MIDGGTSSPGSITIYMLLSLVLVMGIIFTMAEAARVNCINGKLRAVTYMAADSCFAEFASEVFDEYGIMALWMEDAQLLNTFNNYVDHNLNFSDLDVYADADLYHLQRDGSALGAVEHLTDNGGFPFKLQVYEYMDYFLVREALEKFLSYIDIYGAGSKVASFLSKINEYKDVFLKVANAAARIQRTVDQAKSLAYNPRSILGNMQYGLDMYLATDNVTYISEFNAGYWDLKASKNRMKRYMQQIQEQSEDFYDNSARAAVAIEQMQEILDGEGTEYDPELLSGLQAQVDELRLKTADRESDYYAVEANASRAADYSAKLDSLDYLLAATDPKDAKDNAAGYRALVAAYGASFSSFDPELLGLNMTEYSGKRQDAGFMNVIGSVFSEGLLKAVAGNKISKKKLTATDLPSALKTKGTSSAGSAAGFSGPWRTLEFGEYIIGHFGDFTHPSEDTALCYETEYVIAGKTSDRENLETVARELVLMRSGLNIASFMKDTQKMGEARLLAEAIIGFTGMELLVQLVKLVIISLWCIAEALCDVKALMAGEKVPILKDEGSWAVSATNIGAFKKSLLPAVTDQAGLSYEDHLRILLYLEKDADRTFRTMDVIQANANEKYNQRFRLAQCVSSLEVYVSYSAPQVFAAFGFVRNIVGNGGGRFSFRYVQDFAYTKSNRMEQGG